MPRNRSTRWPGCLCFIPLIAFGIFATSVIAFGFAISYVRQISKAPLERYAVQYYGRQQPSNARVFFYSATMPFLSILHAIADIMLYFAASVSPLHSLVLSIVFSIGWLAQWTLWMDCEITTIGSQNSNAACFQNDFEPSSSSSFLPQGVSAASRDARVGCGGVVLAFYLITLGCAAVAVHQNRMRRKQGARLENKGDESELAPVLK